MGGAAKGIVMISLVARWIPLPFDRLPSLADAWRVVDFFGVIPQHVQGSLLLEMNRGKVRACLVELPDRGPMFLLRMRTGALWLETNSGARSRAIAGQSIRHDNAWILALMPGNGEFPAGALQLVQHDRWPGLRIGSDGLELKPMKGFRPWSWRWKPTCGTGNLAVYVNRTADQIRTWLRENPYLDTSRTLGVSDGLLSFSTSLYHGLSREQAGYDQAILASLSQGALGELTFDLIDTDYGALCTTGHSCAELAAYLDPAHLWNDDCYALTVRLKPDEEPWETIRLAIEEYGGEVDTLRIVPFARLPRWLLVEVPLRMMPVDLNLPEGWNYRIRLRTATVYRKGCWNCGTPSAGVTGECTREKNCCRN